MICFLPKLVSAQPCLVLYISKVCHIFPILQILGHLQFYTRLFANSTKFLDILYRCLSLFSNMFGYTPPAFLVPWYRVMAWASSAVAPAQDLLGQVRGSAFLTTSYTPHGPVRDPQSDLIDLLTVTASELQEQLRAGTTTTMELVKMYLHQIETHNHNGLKLHAMISTAPIDLLIVQAKELDNELSKGTLRGPLHGIPIVVKDNIMTDSALGMATTCGSYALVGAKTKNAPIVDRILKAGMIILGKANLSVSVSLHLNIALLTWFRNGLERRASLLQQVGLQLVAKPSPRIFEAA